MYFCGFAGAASPSVVSSEFETALASLGLEFHRLCDTDPVIFCGPNRPRGFVALSSPEYVAALAGELLWEGESPGVDCADEIRRLAACLAENRPEDLARANGSFAALVYDSGAPKLWLIADSLGGRPLYFCESGGAIFFSTILEVLLRVRTVPRTFLFDAFVDRETLYCPMGDLTFFREIRVLRDSEYLCWQSGRVKRGRYFDWTRIEFRARNLEEAADVCAAALRASVRDRAPMDGEEARVLLSGGLDSRCVTALLHELGIPLRASTLRLDGCQDYEYARRFAELLRIPLEAVAFDPEPFPLATGLDVVRLLPAAARPFLPGRVFTGDGGGETFGLLLLRADVAELLETDWREALRRYASKRKIPLRVFRGEWRKIASTRPLQALEEVFGEYSHMPPQKAMHLFVLTSDLRRHLHDFFEVAPLIGFDLAAPFYDRRVLMSVLELAPPLGTFLEYRLYHEILKRMPPSCAQVPWQTYPGRMPCPVRDDRPAPKSQWDLLKEQSPRRLRFFSRLAARDLLRGRIPFRYFRPAVTAAAVALSVAGIGDYAHVLRLVLALSRELRRAEPDFRG